MNGSEIDRQRIRTRRLAYGAVLTAIALVLSVVERWIPLDLIVPVPGLKLGLANIVTLFALMRLRPTDALMILIMRCLIVGSFTGPTALLFSLTGGCLAWATMALLCKLEGRFLSPIGISVAGSAAHHIGQMIVAVLLLQQPILFQTYLPPLLLTGMATGTLTGIAASPLIRHVTGLRRDVHDPGER